MLVGLPGRNVKPPESADRIGYVQFAALGHRHIKIRTESGIVRERSIQPRLAAPLKPHVRIAKHTIHLETIKGIHNVEETGGIVLDVVNGIDILLPGNADVRLQ